MVFCTEFLDGGGLESRYVGRVCCADGAARLTRIITVEKRSSDGKYDILGACYVILQDAKFNRSI